MKSHSVSVPLIPPVPQVIWSSLVSKFDCYFMVSYSISSLCSGIPFRKCRSISRAKKLLLHFFKLDKNFFLWRLGTVLILVWTNYSALIPGPWYASVFDQKELAWRPAQERFKVKCFDLNHSAPIHERRWEGALCYKTRISAMQSVTCSITMHSIQKEMFRGAEGFKHKSLELPDGSGCGKTHQGLQQNSLACEMVPYSTGMQEIEISVWPRTKIQLFVVWEPLEHL